MLTYGVFQLLKGNDDKDSKVNFLFSLNQMSFLIDLFQVMALSLYQFEPKIVGSF